MFRSGRTNGLCAQASYDPEGERMILRLVAVLSVVLAGSVHAQQQEQTCGPRQVVTDFLANNFAETRIGMGTTANGSVLIEIYANLETGTWTALSSTHEGPVCMVAEGQDFEMLDEELVQGERS